MSALHITIVRPDDDHLSIEVNGEQVASANFDDHGRSGMDAVAWTATAIAEAAGIDIHTEWRPDEVTA